MALALASLQDTPVLLLDDALSAVDDVDKIESMMDLAPHITAYFVLTVGLSAGVLVFIRSAGGLANHMSHDIRRDCFHRLQELEFSYFDHRPIGWMISRFTSDGDKLSSIIAWGTLDLIWAACLVLMIAVILVVLNPMLGLLVLAVVPPLICDKCSFSKEVAPELTGYAEV